MWSALDDLPRDGGWAFSRARCSRGDRCRWVRHQSLTVASERANRLLAVVCRTTFLPFRDFAQEWVKPRKSNEWALQSGGYRGTLRAHRCVIKG
jgi:hypothetical protein